MHRLKFFTECLARAFWAEGARALGGMAPFSESLYPVAVNALARLREDRDDQESRAAVQDTAHASPAEARQAAEAVVLETATDQPKVTRQALTNYLSQVPAVLRHFLKRPADMTGMSAPGTLALRTPEDLLALLPARLPCYQPGARPRGVGDW